MDAVLIVVRPFGGHGVGDVIADAGQMREALAGEHARDVVRVAVPPKPPQRRREV
ncbi:MAG: hypothetical protein WDN04_16750 [Rhodospirillales bacterium]